MHHSQYHDVDYGFTNSEVYFSTKMCVGPGVKNWLKFTITKYPGTDIKYCAPFFKEEEHKAWECAE